MSNNYFLDFVVIGAMKAGTSSLYNYLSLHPELSLPYTEKEVNFFNNEEHWKAGLDWYRTNFENSELKKGEVNPNYAMFPTCKVVPERLSSFAPNAKLIYILRDPIERFCSHIHHNYIKGLETRSLQNIIEDREDSLWYIAYSQYYSQLERFLTYYDKNQILVITLEKLSQEPTLIMRRIFEFLEVNPNYFSESFQVKQHISEDKVKPGKLLTIIRKTAFSKVYQQSKYLFPMSLHKQTKKILGQAIEKPNLTIEQTSYLLKIFQEDIIKLKDFTSLDFYEWKHPY